MQELTRQSELRWLAVIFIAAAILFGIGMSRTGFEGKDERRYAQAAKEIQWGSDFFVMHYLGQLYPDKPPLFFWMQKASYEVFGEVSPFAARVPLWITSMLALGFAYLCIRQISGVRTALIATVALLLMFRFFWSGRWARLDMPMCAFTFGAFWASARILFSREDQPPAGWGWAALAWVMAALAILSKGPGVIVWIGTFVTYALVRKDFSVIRRHHVLSGVGLMGLIVAAWLVPAMIFGGRDYWEPMFGVHVVERFAGVVRHDKPFYYFFGKIFLDTMPVAILLPASLWLAWKNRSAQSDGGRTLFYICWLVFGLIFFSIPEGKRGQYILPLYPAVAALVAHFVVAALADDRLRGILRRHVCVLIALAFAGAVAALVYKGVISDFLIPPPMSLRIVLFVVFVVGAVLAWKATCKGSELRALGWLSTMVGLVYGSLCAVYFPQNRSDQMYADAARYIEANRPGLEGFGIYTMEDELPPYFEKVPLILDQRDDVLPFMKEARGRWAICRRESFQRLVKKVGNPGWRHVKEWKSPHGKQADLLLLESRR